MLQIGTGGKEAAGSSEMLVPVCQTIQHYIPENYNLKFV
jgi:hypothetical protein